jgi:hypothetical protein
MTSAQAQTPLIELTFKGARVQKTIKVSPAAAHCAVRLALIVAVVVLLSTGVVDITQLTPFFKSFDWGRFL